jgi:HEAT repeat protein
MDILALFRRSPEKQIQRLRKKVKEPHGDASVRENAARRLFEMGTTPAIRALLDRYTINVSPSSQDEREKSDVYSWLVQLGSDAVPPIMDYLKNERFVYWPFRALRGILEGSELIEEVQKLLRFHWEHPPASAYPKAQIIRSLEDLHSPELEETVRLFLDDEDDDVRLEAIEYLMRRPEEDSRKWILETYLKSEDRPRIQNQILDRLVEKGWTVRGYRPAVEASLPEAFTLTREGRVRRVGA